MNTIYADETNTRPSANVKFLICGGLILPDKHDGRFYRGMEKIRKDAGYRPGDELKFDTRARPAWVSIENATEAKRAVVNLCLECDCKFIAMVILHDIIKSQIFEKSVCEASGYVFSRFNLHLKAIDDYGRVCLDRLPGKDAFKPLNDMFVNGIHIKHKGCYVRLDRITGFSTASVNSSHGLSAADIVLGSFRYCVNHPEKREIAQAMMRKIHRLFLRDPTGSGDIQGSGLIYRPDPDLVEVPRYREEYRRLRQELNALLTD